MRVNLGSEEGLFIHTIQLNSHPQIKELVPSYILKYSNHEYVMDIFLGLCVYLRREWQHSVLAWRIPWTEEPGMLQSTGLQRVGYNWSNIACMNTFFKNVQPQIFFLTINTNLTFYYIFVDSEVQILMSVNSRKEVEHRKLIDRNLNN